MLKVGAVELNPTELLRGLRVLNHRSTVIHA